MQPSIFIRIVNNEIPCHKIYEDATTLAFLDIHPSVPGHALVMLKQQIEFIWDVPPDEYQALMGTVQKVGAHMRATLEAAYIGIKVMGTDVPHVHVHLVPFKTMEEYAALPDFTAEPDHQALAAMAKRLAF